MKKIEECNYTRVQRPIRVVQFGAGNFLRAFVDEMVDELNEKTDFNGNIAIVKSTPLTSTDAFHMQDNFYTVVFRGRENGVVVNQSRVVTAVEQVITAKEEHDKFLALARLESLRFVVSNTTEAGIVLDESDTFTGVPQTYPGKLTKFLYERFRAFDGATDKGLIILPVELIDDNGKELKRCVLSLCDAWHLEDAFKTWVETANIFCSTLVDRIVTGYPKGETEAICKELGYEDRLLDVCEPFGLWVIESEQDLTRELPFVKAGLPVVFTKNVTPYKKRKVRVLNGAHTASVLAAFLGGVDIVRDMMHHAVLGRMVRELVNEEIVPNVPLPQEEVKEFAQSVYERFDNPYIDHELLAISLNSVSKWKTRVLPSFRDGLKKNGALPKWLTFSFAALLAFYRSDDLQEDGLHAARLDGTAYIVRDGRDELAFFAKASQKELTQYVQTVAANTAFWGDDLTAYEGFVAAVTKDLEDILQNPVQAVEERLGK